MRTQYRYGDFSNYSELYYHQFSERVDVPHASEATDGCWNVFTMDSRQHTCPVLQERFQTYSRCSSTRFPASVGEKFSRCGPLPNSLASVAIGKRIIGVRRCVRASQASDSRVGTRLAAVPPPCMSSSTRPGVHCQALHLRYDQMVDGPYEGAPVCPIGKRTRRYRGASAEPDSR